MTKRRIMPVISGGLAFMLMCGTAWQFMPGKTAAGGAAKAKAAAVFSSDNVATADENSTIMLNAARINVKSDAAQAIRGGVGDFSGKRLHLVKFTGAIQPEWVKGLEADGLQIVDYIPSFAYLVYGDATSLQKMQTRANNGASAIEWDGEYAAAWRIQPDVYAYGAKGEITSQLASDLFTVQLVRDDVTNLQTLGVIESLQKRDIVEQWEVEKYRNYVVALDEAGVKALSEKSDVISISAFLQPKKNDERQDIIMTGALTGNAPTPGNYLDYLAGKGFTQAQFDASGFVVNVVDDGIDSGASNTAGVPNPLTQFTMFRLGDPASTSRLAFNRPYGTATLADSRGCAGHGNLNATIIGGYVPNGAPFNAAPHSDAAGYKYGLGVAPYVKLGGSTIFNAAGTFTSPNLLNLEAEAYRDGARISSNSWGSGSQVYDARSQTYDSQVRDAQGATSSVSTAGNQEMLILFAAGNGGAGSNTIGNPANAKNLITVGASENVHPFGGADGCGVADVGADSANDIIGFSSRGPTADGRKKPEIVAPGTHITGGVYQAAPATSPITGTGAANACFDATGVCAGVGAAPNGNFFPSNGQQWYTASSGTSHSTPALAGASALIRQDFLNRSLSAPSPAMTKAMLMNTARYMTGTGANDNLWSNNQGMGMVALNSYFDVWGRPRIVRDQTAADTFTASGQQRVFTGNIVDSTKPFRVTVAWSDAPGPTTGNAYVNNLDLEVSVGGQRYLGNVFTGANSSTGGIADVRNNAESVFVPAGVTGPVVVRVRAVNIAGDAIPGNAATLEQDFALVVQNVNEAPVAAVESTGVTYVSDNGTPVNNVPDPGETVTVSLGLQNSGTANSGNVTVTLLNTGGITDASAAQNYGALPAGGTAVTRNFTFKVPANAVCGSQITLTFQVNDGTSTFNVTQTYTLGTLQQSFAENFDTVTAPALPAGWTTTQTGGGVLWVTSTTASDTPPNNAFTSDPAVVGLSELESPAINVTSAAAQLRFRNNYDTEAGVGAFYDGMVLEIKIGDGAYQDILAAGGTFVSGGYSGTLNATFGNPLGGRQAWSGNSAGYINTVVTLPAAANGQSVRFKWRMGSDSSVADVGVRIDTIQVFGNFQCSNPGTPTAPTNSRADFDGDGRTDLSVFRGGNWFVQRSTAGFAGVNWGTTGDTVLSGDFNADNRTDFAVYRPSSTAGQADAYILLNGTNNFIGLEWGQPGDKPLVGDFDGDNDDDLIVYRSSNNTFYVLPVGGGAPTVTQINGTSSSQIPVMLYYDTDNRADLAMWNPATGVWSIRNSATGAVETQQWGTNGDRLVAADYDNDNRDDLAIYRGAGQWWIRNSSNGATQVITFGTASDVPVPGDYDGDGDDDIAVFRNGAWFVRTENAAGYAQTNFGSSGDTAIPSVYVQQQ